MHEHRRAQARASHQGGFETTAAAMRRRAASSATRVHSGCSSFWLWLARPHKLPRDAHPLLPPSFPVKFHALHRRVDLLHDVKDRSALLAVGSNLRIDGRENALLGRSRPSDACGLGAKCAAGAYSCAVNQDAAASSSSPSQPSLPELARANRKSSARRDAIDAASGTSARNPFSPGLRLLPIEARNVLLRRAPRAVRAAAAAPRMNAVEINQ